LTVKADRHQVERLLVLQSRISLPEAEIRRQAKPDRHIDALTAIPGIGLLSAMTLVSEVGDISPFATARKLCAWAGIIPSMRNSDRTVHHGHITRAGPAAVRHVLAGIDIDIESRIIGGSKGNGWRARCSEICDR